MPIKHQTESYRYIGGQKWVCWGDFGVADGEAEKTRLRNSGLQVRSVPCDGDMRLFVPEKQETITGPYMCLCGTTMEFHINLQDESRWQQCPTCDKRSN